MYIISNSQNTIPLSLLCLLPCGGRLAVAVAVAVVASFTVCINDPGSCVVIEVGDSHGPLPAATMSVSVMVSGRLAARALSTQSAQVDHLPFW
jgi:hypothetical protein